MSWDMFKRLTPRGKRRAALVVSVETVIRLAILTGVGYGCCLLMYGLKLLLGVA